MKKIFISAVLVSFAYCIYCQNKWASIGTEWYYSIPNDVGNPLYHYERYLSEKDTTIEEKVCKKIKSDHSLEIMFEDKNRVYYWYNNKFRLIYDFSSKIADTVVFEFKSFSPNSIEIDTSYKVKCVIEDIDTILIGSNNIKKYTTSLIQDDELVHIVWPSKYIYFEKIGYEYDFLFYLSIPSVGFVNRLRCYNDSQINFITDWWQTQKKECDYSLLNLSSENKKLLENIYLYPNPANNCISVHIPKINENDSYFIRIYDINGKILIEQKILNSIDYIDISSFNNGIYNVSIVNHCFTQEQYKIIKL